MKKFGILVLFFLSLIVIAGCQSTDEKVVYVEVIALNGDVLIEETITYEDESISLLDLIDEAVDLDYQMSEYGAFISGIGSFYPREHGITWNYWFSLYVDDEMSMTGLDQIELRDGIKISFVESTMLDEIDIWVDDMIQSLIENHLSDYINETTFEFNVGLAYHQLSLFNTSFDEIKDLVETPTRLETDSLSGIYQNIVLDLIYGLDVTSNQALLEAQNVDNVYFALTQLNGLMMTSSESSKIDSLLDTLTSTTPEYMDSDYAGMLLQTLSFSGLESKDGVTSKIADMITYILENISSEGMLAYGNPNASSTAQVILGLVAQGLDPRGEDYTVEGVDLIAALKTFQLETAFKYTLASEDADLAFSTPQAFAALVMYKIYRDTFQNPKVSLYQFS